MTCPAVAPQPSHSNHLFDCFSGRDICHNDVILREQGRYLDLYIKARPSLSELAGRSRARIPAGLEAELLYCICIVFVCVLLLCVR